MKRQLKKLTGLSLVLASVLMFSCKNDENKTTSTPMQNEMHQETHDGDTSEDKVLADNTTAEFQDKNTATVYEHYIEIKTALVKTNAEDASEHAKMLVESLEEINTDDDIITPAKQIAENDDVELQRASFSELTSKMGVMLEGALASGEIYRQYCPMAFEGKGDSWYSNSKEIRNPYFGDKMLKCGRVEETIQK